MSVEYNTTIINKLPATRYRNEIDIKSWGLQLITNINGKKIIKIKGIEGIIDVNILQEYADKLLTVYKDLGSRYVKTEDRRKVSEDYEQMKGLANRCAADYLAKLENYSKKYLVNSWTKIGDIITVLQLVKLLTRDKDGKALGNTSKLYAFIQLIKSL